MNNEYLDKLPHDIRSLVEEIEEKSDIEIEIQIDATRISRSFDQKGSLACEVDQYSARILIPTADYFPEGSVLHELLHIRRFLLEGVPQIVVCDDYEDWTPQLDKGLRDLDNRLEHLVIVPEELNLRPDRRSYWESVMCRVLDELQTTSISEDDRKRYAQLDWIFVRNVVDSCCLTEQAQSLTTQLGIIEQAASFNAALLLSLPSKESTVRVCFEHLNIPFEIAALEYLNSRNGTKHTVNLMDIA